MDRISHGVDFATPDRNGPAPVHGGEKSFDVEGRLPLCFAMEKAKSVKSSYTPPTATKSNAADGDRGLEEVNCAKPVTRLRGKEKKEAPVIRWCWGFLSCAPFHVTGSGGFDPAVGPVERWGGMVHRGQNLLSRGNYRSVRALLSGPFRTSRSLAAKHVGRKEIICAPSFSRRPRRIATSAVASCDSRRSSQPTEPLNWRTRFSSASRADGSGYIL